MNIADVNDNAPQFEKTSYIGSVTEGAGIGSTVITVSATDNDLGFNGRIHYEVVDGNQDGML